MTVPSKAVELQAGALRLALRPDLGGCIAGLWHGGMPVLRSTEPARSSSSRAVGLLSVAAVFQPRRLPPLPAGSASSTRTLAELRRQPAFGARRRVGSAPWSVVSAQPSSDSRAALCACRRCRLAIRVRSATDFTLSAERARTARWRSPTRRHRDAPVGLGWHPYFPKRARSRLHIELSDRWDSDARRSCRRARSRSRASMPTSHTCNTTIASKAGAARRTSATNRSRCSSARRCATSSSSRRRTAPTTASSR